MRVSETVLLALGVVFLVVVGGEKVPCTPDQRIPSLNEASLHSPTVEYPWVRRYHDRLLHEHVTNKFIESKQCGYLNQCVDNWCEHKDLQPIVTVDYVAGFLAFLGTTLSVVGGVGGGGLFVPLLMLVLNFSAESAVPLSKAMIFAGSIVALPFLLKTRVRGQTAIDYDVCLLLQPLCLAGTTMGVFINIMTPNWIIVLILFVILSLTTHKTYIKASTMYRKERAAQQKKLAIAQGETTYLLDSSSADEDAPAMVPPYDPKTAIATKAEYDEYVKTVEQHMSIPLRKVAVLASVWIVLFVCSISKKFLGCNWSFAALSVVPFLYALAITVWRSSIAVHEYNLKIKCQHVFHPTDFIWTPSTVVTYPGVAFMAGVTAGAVGIGGAMVLGPILLLMSKENDPVITSSISGFLVLFTSSATTTQFFLLGTLNMPYALFLGGLCMAAALLARLGIKPIMDRTGRKSFILLALTAVIAISGVLTLVQGFRQWTAVEEAHLKPPFQWSDLCKGGH